MRKSVRESATAWAFLFPYLAFYALFMLYPIVKGFVMSLRDGTIIRDGPFVGLEKYLDMFRDEYFWESLWHTCYFVIISTPTITAFGLLLALVVNSRLAGTWLLRTSFFMPFVLAVSVIASTWKFILRPYSGFISSVLHTFGYAGEVFWLDEPRLAWLSILVATLWWTVGFNMVLFLAGLQDIPDDYYEAARMDGASGWQQFRFITLPSLKGVIALVVVLQTIASFKLFAQPWLMTEGGPGTETRALVQYVYQTGFIFENMGQASAMAYVLFLVTIVIAFFQFRLMGRRKSSR